MHCSSESALAAISMTMLLALPSHAGEDLVSGLKWMSGCWANMEGEAGTGEQWTAPAGRSMLGMSRTVRGGVMVAFEFLRITQGGDGKVVLVASPSGQQPATFALQSLSRHEVVFENPDHDFPQRVIYRRMSGTRLTGRVEGIVDGALRSIDFPMKKADCASGAGA